jgi:hypothetical protein
MNEHGPFACEKNRNSQSCLEEFAEEYMNKEASGDAV